MRHFLNKLQETEGPFDGMALLLWSSSSFPGGEIFSDHRLAQDSGKCRFSIAVFGLPRRGGSIEIRQLQRCQSSIGNRKSTFIDQ
jgi:hypothetical protein